MEHLMSLTLMKEGLTQEIVCQYKQEQPVLQVVGEFCLFVCLFVCYYNGDLQIGVHVRDRIRVRLSNFNPAWFKRCIYMR